MGEKTHMKTAILAASRAKYQQIHNRSAGEMDKETLIQELYNARKLKLESKLVGNESIHIIWSLKPTLYHSIKLAKT